MKAFQIVALNTAIFIASIIGSACVSNRSPESSDLSEQIHRIENGLQTYHVVSGEPAMNINDRLQHYNVPGVSVAVVIDGQILWAHAWGETEAGSGIDVDTETLFQAASISKPVAAAGALRFVERGLLNFDSDINLSLRSWKVQENEYTIASKVTLRRLLSHSAGTNVHGFPGYSQNEPVPTLLELLDGTEPSNTEAVRVNSIPGSQWRYSGGGTSIVQLLMSEVAELPFDKVMENEILEPAGMNHSTFSQPLPVEFQSRAATGHHSDGMPIEGKYHTYPEQAAAGLWTTPTDLAHFAIEIQSAFAGSEDQILSPEMAQIMLSVEAGNWGLGFSIRSENKNEFWFEHGGANAGFRAHFTMLGESGKGIVIMSNGDQGNDLIMEIMRAISVEYDLPGYRPIIREAIELEKVQLDSFTGNYYMAGTSSSEKVMQIRLVETDLMADVPLAGWQGKELRTESEESLFFIDNPGELNFERNESGEVTKVVISGLGAPIELERR